MAITRVNLDREVSRAIHFPRFEDAPLYTRVPDCKEAYVDKSEDVSNKSEAWIRKSQLTYSSPNNIRRLFITSEGVNVHLFQPIMYKGKGGNPSLSREKKYSQFKPEEAYMSLSQGKRDFVITKSGLGALSYPWVASNVEEVYFDWTTLLSEDVLNMGMGNLLVDINSQQTTRVERSDIPYKIFTNFCCRGESISNKFPRLKVIGYIQQLSRVYKMVDNRKGRESVEEMHKLWCTSPVIKSAGADPNCRVLLHYVDNVPKINLTYRIRDGIYLYDREVLLPYFESVKKKTESALKRDKEQKSEFEKILDKAYETEGPKKAQTILRVSLFDIPEEEKEKAFNEMSSAGRERYMKLLQ